LFARYRDALLDSYFITAADVPETADAAKVPTAEAVGNFVSAVRNAGALESLGARDTVGPSSSCERARSAPRRVPIADGYGLETHARSADGGWLRKAKQLSLRGATSSGRTIG